MSSIATIESLSTFGLQVFTLLIGGFSLLFLSFCLGCAVSDLFSKPKPLWKNLSRKRNKR